MADTEPDKRWYDRLFDDGSAELYAGDPGLVSFMIWCRAVNRR